MYGCPLTLHWQPWNSEAVQLCFVEKLWFVCPLTSFAEEHQWENPTQAGPSPQILVRVALALCLNLPALVLDKEEEEESQGDP